MSVPATGLGRRALRGIRRAFRVSMAFLRMDAREQLNYPLGLLMQQVGGVVPIVTFYFVAQFVKPDASSAAGDYYTFVVVGIIGMRLLRSGLDSLSRRVEQAIWQGRLEMLLVEPIRWELLPFTMVQWSILLAVISAASMVVLSLFLGANYRLAGVGPALAIVVLGLVASLGIGILNTAVKVLSKRSDVVLNLYVIATNVLAGTYYSVDVLPSWMQRLSWLIPHTYVLQALRRVLLPGGDQMEGPTAIQAALALAVFSLLVYPMALWVYRRSFEYGRKMGFLAGY